MDKFTTKLKSEWSAHAVSYIILATILAVVIVYYIGWKKSRPVVPFTPVQQIPEVVKHKIKPVSVPVKGGKVVTLDKAAVIKYVPGLPEDFINNPDKQATVTGDIKPSESHTDVVSVIDTNTGVSELIARERPLPFMAFENKGAIGGRYGISTRGKEADIYAQKSFGRIGGFHIGGYVEGSYYPDKTVDMLEGKAMIFVEHAW